MSSTSSSATDMKMNTSTKPASATGAKKVAKKEAAPVAAAPAPVAAPAPAAEPKAKKAAAKATASAAPAAAPAPVVVASTPVEVAPAAAAPAAPVTTLDEDLKTVTASLTTLRDTAAALLAQVKKLDKRVHREIKDARKRKRRSATTEEGADAKPRQPSIFERPVAVTDELCVFLGKAKGTQMSRSEVTKGVNQYVKDKELKDKHSIKPDAALKKLLALPEGTALTYFNLQRFLNRHYVKAVAVATA